MISLVFMIFGLFKIETKDMEEFKEIILPCFLFEVLAIIYTAFAYKIWG